MPGHDGSSKFKLMDATKLITNLGESIICPVCLNMFAGRIRQCLVGHSVCDDCYGKLTECPTCRGHLADHMRNYTLEDLIARLHHAGLSSTLAAVTSTDDNEDLAERASPAIAKGPVQGRGLFTCRASHACSVRLPICRLYNHLRQLHGDNFVTSTAQLLRPAGAQAANHRYETRMTVSLRRSTYRAVHIRKSGLFFVCFQALNGAAPAVKKSSPAVPEVADDADALPTHMAWVQMACTNGEARAFRFRCELVYGQTQATFEDPVFGEPWRFPALLENRHTLCVRVPGNLAKATLRVSISANEEFRDTRRRKNTQLRTLGATTEGGAQTATATATVP